MITKITTENFKRFGSQAFTLAPLSLLAGPNNSGKSTLLQAVMVWNLGLQRWVEKRGPGSGFHQVLLIPAFLFARPSSLILLDEPDAVYMVVGERIK